MIYKTLFSNEKEKLIEDFHFWLIVSCIFLLLGNKLLGILDDCVKMDY